MGWTIIIPLTSTTFVLLLVPVLFVLLQRENAVSAERGVRDSGSVGDSELRTGEPAVVRYSVLPEIAMRTYELRRARTYPNLRTCETGGTAKLRHRSVPCELRPRTRQPRAGRLRSGSIRSVPAQFGNSGGSVFGMSRYLRAAHLPAADWQTADRTGGTGGLVFR